MSVTAIILTFNEEQHITRCIASLKPVVTRIVVVDSFSTDRTVELARAAGAEVVQNVFVSQAHQYRWAIAHADITTDWTLRVDADEYLDTTLQTAMAAFLRTPGAVNAVYLRRQVTFLGRPIRHGFFYPLLILRLYRTGQGVMEQRWMDEHIRVDQPVTTTLPGDLVDDNRNDLAWWTAKHVNYARREAWEIIASRDAAEAALSGAARRKRWLKTRVYNRLPAGLRAGLYFLYRYVLGRGFLDGREGFYFHLLQGFWYRTYVDATLFELEQEAARHGVTPRKLLEARGIL